MFRAALVGGAPLAHSQCMTVRGWGRVLLAATLLAIQGCATDQASSGSYGGTTGGHHGGQTGSLEPCSTPADFTGQPTVPTGDAAFVFHAGCMMMGEFGVTDSAGNPVPFEVVELEGGAVLLKTDAALTQGSYHISTPDGGVQTVNVGEVAPLPGQIGALSREAGSCSTLFTLSLHQDMLPYLPLLRLEYAIDGGTPTTWFEYGTVTPENGYLFLQLPWTPATGDHEIEVFASIAGEASAPAPSSLDFAMNCQQPSDGGFACQLTSRPLANGSAPLAAALACLFLVIPVFRTRRRRSAS